MKKFLDQDFLLQSETAKTLYHNYAKDLPIIDFHNHLDAQEIYENKKFENLTDLWLGTDHYKWRAMRTLGVDESLITGDACPREKFRAWAKCMPFLIGSPLYHWSHLELQRYFEIETLISEKTADEIYDKVNAFLSQDNFTVRGLLDMQKVQVVSTTDDPVDDLKYHKLIQEDDSTDLQIFPTFRPDKAVNINAEVFNEWIDTLSQVVGFEINTLDNLYDALAKRMDFFKEMGANASDNGIDVFAFVPSTKAEAEDIFIKGRQGKSLTEEEISKYKSQLLLFLGKEYHKRDWIMQLHIGALRHNNKRKVKELGPDSGFDAVGNNFDVAQLGAYLNALAEEDKLSKTIIYNLNPTDNHKVVTLMQCFQDGKTQSKMQFGSGWWFMDQKDGMIDQMRALAANGVLSKFIGMLTDSRSFLSFPRHEYFRRLLCNLLGEYVELGEYPADMEFLGQVVQDISYNNSKEYFNFDVSID